MAPTFRHGKSAFFSITSATGGTVNLSSGLDSVTQDRSVETADVTTFGDNDRNFIAGLRTGTFNVSGHMASTYAAKMDPLLGHSTNPTFVYGPQGNTTGGQKRKYTGQCILTNIQYGADVGDKVSFTATAQITGAVTSTHYG